MSRSPSAPAELITTPISLGANWNAALPPRRVRGGLTTSRRPISDEYTTIVYIDQCKQSDALVAAKRVPSRTVLLDVQARRPAVRPHTLTLSGPRKISSLEIRR